jgi:hypothetical protein
VYRSRNHRPSLWPGQMDRSLYLAMNLQGWHIEAVIPSSIPLAPVRWIGRSTLLRTCKGGTSKPWSHRPFLWPRSDGLIALPRCEHARAVPPQAASLLWLSRSRPGARRLFRSAHRCRTPHILTAIWILHATADGAVMSSPSFVIAVDNQALNLKVHHIFFQNRGLAPLYWKYKYDLLYYFIQ